MLPKDQQRVLRLVLGAESGGVHLLESAWDLHLRGWGGGGVEAGVGGLESWHAADWGGGALVSRKGSGGTRGDGNSGRVHAGGESHVGDGELASRGLRGGGGGALLLLLGLFWLPVEEQVHHHVPWVGRRHGASHLQDHSAEDVVQDSDRVLSLVVRWDGDVDVLQGRVGVAESNGGQVAVRRLAAWLGVGPWVGQDKKSGLLVLVGDLVGEGSWGVSSWEGLGASVLGELQDGALSVGSSGQDGDVLWVLDGADHAGGHLKLLPGLAEVEDVESVLPPAVDVSLHLMVAVLRTEVARRRKHHLDIGFLLTDRHLC
mmetsp:Transcript_3734/g.9711  ORF Transcript_3734/g.9711 Transcript_3734/m.9711 type:complete len:316 (+) Transcript_3734:322-1269(+)